MTQWIEVSIKELFDIVQEDLKQGRKVDEEETCSICMCELYENIH